MTTADIERQLHTMICDYCGIPNPVVHCAQCKSALYCNEHCALDHWNLIHNEKCLTVPNDVLITSCNDAEWLRDVTLDIGALNLPNQPPAKDISFRKRGFYKASVKKMNNLFKEDLFAWLCIMSFKTSPVINYILFQVNGDLTKLDQTFNGVVAAKARVASATKYEKDRYSIFATFFKNMLKQALEIGRPLRHSKTRKVILKKRDFLSAFPSLRRLLSMRDKAEFVRIYVYTLQKTIYSIPKLKKRINAWRGYKPLNIANSMSLDVRKMRIGQEITNWAFMSVSLDSRVSTLFLDHKKTCCMVTIIIPPGIPAFLISGDSGDPLFPKDITPWYQMEILLPVGCVFKVVELLPYKTLYETTNANEGLYSHTAVLMLTGIRKLKK